MAKEKKTKNEKTNNRSFMKDFRAELKKVVWPTSKQMVNNVVAVITIVIITAAIVFVFDFLFGSINKYGLDKLKNNVRAKNETQVVQNVEENTATENENNPDETNNQNQENNETESDNKAEN